MDALASQSAVWDRWIATSDQPIEVLRPAWEATAWAQAYRQHGTVELFSDVPDLLSGVEACFDAVTSVPTNGSDSLAADLVDTQLGQLIAAAIERDAAEEPWSVLWLHSGFLTRCWDAPRDLFPIDEHEHLDAFAEDDQHEPETSKPASDALPLIFDDVCPPHLQLDSDVHPDLINSWMRTYGCQVRLVDLLLEVLLQTFAEYDPQVVLMGTSGFQLGQNGWIGSQAGPLRNPEIRLPLLISDCGPLRFPQLTSTDTLVNLFEELSRGKLATARWVADVTTQESVETKSERAQRALSTPSWFVVRDEDASEHLFLKPDDVEDFNDVARIRTDVVTQFLD